MPNIDKIDRALIAALQNDARLTNRDLAAAVRIAPSTALERVRGLRARGVIAGTRLDLDLAKIGRPVQALIAVRVRPPTRERIEAFRRWAAGLEEVIGLFVTTGPEDFLLHLAVPDNEHLYAFVIDRLTARTEVADVRTSIVYEHLRAESIVPADGV